MNFLLWMKSFIFFGFLVAGEEIEGVSTRVEPHHYSKSPILAIYLSDPFGYDANDLNLDHFTHDIIRESLFHSKVPRSFDEHASPLHEGTRTRKVAPASK